jgi:hypothetical protein
MWWYIISKIYMQTKAQPWLIKLESVSHFNPLKHNARSSYFVQKYQDGISCRLCILQSSKVQDCQMHVHRPNPDFGCKFCFIHINWAAMLHYAHQAQVLTMFSFAPMQGSTCKFQSTILRIALWLNSNMG